jgi:DNA-directed RNA polymerase subunit RPC12/RpoP
VIVLVFDCTYCGYKFQLPQDAVNTVVRCPKCAFVIVSPPLPANHRLSWELHRANPGDALDTPPADPPPPIPPKPVWNKETRELWWGDVLVKKYKKHPAPNQVKILDAFQNAGWPATIKNPWHDPRVTSSVSLRTLNETLRAINDTIAAESIRFEAMGNGQCQWKTL